MVRTPCSCSWSCSCSCSLPVEALQLQHQHQHHPPPPQAWRPGPLGLPALGGLGWCGTGKLASANDSLETPKGAESSLLYKTLRLQFLWDQPVSLHKFVRSPNHQLRRWKRLSNRSGWNPSLYAHIE